MKLLHLLKWQSYMDMQQIGVILLMIHRGAKMVWCKEIWRSFMLL